ncbi:hypothetical protein N8I77_001602 [Diaporthe amygdali]|uniref:Heme haloperoxidase family profile domain-containing protein n=1 Tax=Phomopsis amygdali TaxID=1214568 RepID=A0AAD9SRZ3_PHOAM|nr:uncharacterized protein J7T55_012857 [Diaporthe amygdali]KAJ0118605.1 hypothetical protein J7T55_012857 [Diaporthe amygdali]KAK2614803.1 hypothetical protein N8I77_001602 [Diaporthe amygdali]
MRTGFLLVIALIAEAFSQSPDQFAPAGPGDIRGPCPMLNALANHAFLPHNGQNIDENTTAKALDTALNIPPEFGKLLHKAAVRTNPNGNLTNSFNLDHLARHNILEHDASLSRQDAAFGDNVSFNSTVFNETRSNWQDTIDVQQAAQARLTRVKTSNTTNPTFGFTKIGEQFSVGESAAYLIVLGNKTTRTANRTVVEYLFEKERLPTEVGWTRPAEPLGGGDLLTTMDEIRNATAAASGATPQQAKRMFIEDIHGFAARQAM